MKYHEERGKPLKMDWVILPLNWMIALNRRKKRMIFFEDGLGYITAKLDDSVEQEKEENDFLEGVPAIVESIRNKTIECRIYRKKKFHAKAYITHSKFGVVGSAALVGSSNFTLPGITENVELNVQIKHEIETLK
jgi:phosphatidylserine/phosphatidylglycerophosphate/cardiolipin synthase-like enzyme